MKTITYRGETFTAPDWVNYMATDFGGEIYGFELEPYQAATVWMADFVFMRSNRYKYLGETGVSEEKDWQESLEAV